MSKAELLSRIDSDLIAAQKAKNAADVSAIRMLKAALQYKQVELKRELEDADMIDVLARQVKLRRESIEGYEKGGRQDLVDKEQAELKVIERYLPAQMPEDEIKKLVGEAVRTSGASTLKEMGKVMGILTPQVKGRADMGKVSALVKTALSGGQ